MAKPDRDVIETGPVVQALSQPARVTAFAEFYRARYVEALRVVMYAGASEEQGREAVQQTMLEVFQNWERIDKHWPWTRTAVVNTFIKAKQRDIQRVHLTACAGHATPAGDDPAMTVWEDTQWVENLLDTLPPAQREVMVYIVGGWRPAEVALLLGKAPATVRKNLQLARDRLKSELQRNRDLDTRPGVQGQQRGGRKPSDHEQVQP